MPFQVRLPRQWGLIFDMISSDAKDGAGFQTTHSNSIQREVNCRVENLFRHIINLNCKVITKNGCLPVIKPNRGLPPSGGHAAIPGGSRGDLCQSAGGETGHSPSHTSQETMMGGRPLLAGKYLHPHDTGTPSYRATHSSRYAITSTNICAHCAPMSTFGSSLVAPWQSPYPSIFGGSLHGRCLFRSRRLPHVPARCGKHYTVLPL